MPVSSRLYDTLTRTEVIGTFLTFAQFLYVTLQTASSQLYFPNQAEKSKTAWIPRIRKREVPVKRWLVQVFLFLAVSLSEHYGIVEGDWI